MLVAKRYMTAVATVPTAMKQGSNIYIGLIMYLNSDLLPDTRKSCPYIHSNYKKICIYLNFCESFSTSGFPSVNQAALFTVTHSGESHALFF